VWERCVCERDVCVREMCVWDRCVCERDMSYHGLCAVYGKEIRLCVVLVWYRYVCVCVCDIDMCVWWMKYMCEILVIQYLCDIDVCVREILLITVCVPCVGKRYGVATISRLLQIIRHFCKRAHKRGYILQKSPVIWRSLLIEATPSIFRSVVLGWYRCVCVMCVVQCVVHVWDSSDTVLVWYRCVCERDITYYSLCAMCGKKILRSVWGGFD